MVKHTYDGLKAQESDNVSISYQLVPAINGKREKGNLKCCLQPVSFFPATEQI